MRPPANADGRQEDLSEKDISTAYEPTFAGSLWKTKPPSWQKAQVYLYVIIFIPPRVSIAKLYTHIYKSGRR